MAIGLLRHDTHSWPGMTVLDTVVMCIHDPISVATAATGDAQPPP